jgi:protein phosphatase
VLLAVLFGLLGGAVWLGWRYTQSQYYVGANDDGVVAIFRGVPGQVAGLHLSSEQEKSNTKLGELTKGAQDAVKAGIHADNMTDARRKLIELTDDSPGNINKLPPCQPRPSTEPSTGSQAPSAPPVDVSASPNSTSVDTTSPAPFPSISCRPR